MLGVPAVIARVDTGETSVPPAISNVAVSASNERAFVSASRVTSSVVSTDSVAISVTEFSSAVNALLTTIATF
jgi:hypothetical protein